MMDTEIFLDNAATSHPKPEAVYRAVDRALREVGVGPGRGGYGRSIEAARIVFAAREEVASFFGIDDSARVIFTHSATESLNLAVAGLLRPGDHVVTTTMEHNSLARPLHLAERHGIRVTWVEGDRDGFVPPERIAAALAADTRLVALSHCSNVTGTLQDIATIGALARSRGIPFLVDAAQSSGIVPIDAESLGIGLLAAPGHKGLFGPPGTGILCISETVELKPLLVGGTGGSSSGLEQPGGAPERFESGTLNTPGIAGLAAGIRFIRETGIGEIRHREAALTALLRQGLAAIPGVTLFGPADPERHCGPVSFVIAGRDPAEIAFRLDREEGISVRAGLHCAPLAHRTIGTFPTGTVRVSPGFFNCESDIDRLLRALAAMVP